jgi:protein-S-isoprenylcysteine O-methyltransferase Ste14
VSRELAHEAVTGDGCILWRAICNKQGAMCALNLLRGRKTIADVSAGQLDSMDDTAVILILWSACKRMGGSDVRTREDVLSKVLGQTSSAIHDHERRHRERSHTLCGWSLGAGLFHAAARRLNPRPPGGKRWISVQGGRMNTESDIPRTEEHPNAMAGVFKVARALAIFPVVMAAVLFVTTGRLDWTWAWVYLGINLANVFIVGPIAIRANPATIAEHDELEKTEKWDVGSMLYLLAMYIALPLVAGLDVRFGRARNISLAWHVAGGAVLAVGLGLASWVMITNPYVWSEAPAQRNQTVCSTGPYRLVRHPAYAGLILQALGVPILLGSLWALTPGRLSHPALLLCSNEACLRPADPPPSAAAMLHTVHRAAPRRRALRS